MKNSWDFKVLVDKCRKGDPEAERELVKRYWSQLVMVAQDRIGHQLRSRVDGEDVVQSVFRTFFRRIQDGKFRIEDSNGLWNLLLKVTINKTITAARHHTAEKRTITAEDSPSIDWVDAISREPGPEEASVLSELLEQIDQELAKESYIEIFRLICEGHSKSDVANQVGVSLRMVDRVLMRVRRMLENSLQNDGADSPT